MGIFEILFALFIIGVIVASALLIVGVVLYRYFVDNGLSPGEAIAYLLAAITAALSETDNIPYR